MFKLDEILIAHLTQVEYWFNLRTDLHNNNNNNNNNNKTFYIAQIP